MCFFFFKQKTAYEMRISDWSSDVCSSDLGPFQDRLSASTSVSGRACIPRWVRKQRVRQHRSGAETCRIHGDLWTDSPADSDETPPHRSTTSATIRFPKPSLARPDRSEEHTTELQSLMRISYSVFFLKKKRTTISALLHL